MTWKCETCGAGDVIEKDIVSLNEVRKAHDNHPQAIATKCDASSYLIGQMNLQVEYLTFGRSELPNALVCQP